MLSNGLGGNRRSKSNLYFWYKMRREFTSEIFKISWRIPLQSDLNNSCCIQMTKVSQNSLRLLHSWNSDLACFEQSSSNVLIHIHRLLLFQKINMYLISVYLLLLTVNSFLRPTSIEKYFCEKTSDVQIIYLVYINNW